MLKPPRPARPARPILATTLLLTTLLLTTLLSILLIHPSDPFSALLPLPPLHPLPRPPLPADLTIIIKAYICDAPTRSLTLSLLAALRHHHPTLPVLIANDGPLPLPPHTLLPAHPLAAELRLPPDVGISAGRNALVAAVRTPFLALLDDDHLPTPATHLPRALAALRASRFDIVGLRVLNGPGIPERARAAILIPRYVANVSRFAARTLTLCVWNENNGPAHLDDMRVPLPVHVIHNAFVARTDVLRTRARWRDELKVNEHMTFFLDARRIGVRVGYLPSVSVMHRKRQDSVCYRRVRDREDDFAERLDYDDEFEWDRSCGKGFPDFVQRELQSERKARQNQENQEDTDVRR